MDKNHASAEKNSRNQENFNFLKKSKEISREIWHDHDLWVNALAVKGGATAIILGSVVGISYAITLPFILPVIGITLCGGLIGLGIYGIALGSTKTWKSLKDIYKKVAPSCPANEENLTSVEQEPKNDPKNNKKNSFWTKFKEKPLVKKVLDSHTFKTVKNISDKQKKFFLAGMAGTGSAFWLAASTITLVTQVVLLPVIAVSSLITFSTVLAASVMLSAVYGMYLSVKSVISTFKENKKPQADKQEKPANKKKDIENLPALEKAKQKYFSNRTKMNHSNIGGLHNLPKASQKFKKANKNRHKKPETVNKTLKKQPSKVKKTL